MKLPGIYEIFDEAAEHFPHRRCSQAGARRPGEAPPNFSSKTTCLAQEFSSRAPYETGVDQAVHEIYRKLKRGAN